MRGTDSRTGTTERRLSPHLRPHTSRTPQWPASTNQPPPTEDNGPAPTVEPNTPHHSPPHTAATPNSTTARRHHGRQERSPSRRTSRRPSRRPSSRRTQRNPRHQRTRHRHQPRRRLLTKRRLLHRLTNGTSSTHLRKHRLPRNSHRHKLLRTTQTTSLAKLHTQHQKPTRLATHTSIHFAPRQQHLPILRQHSTRSRPRSTTQPRRQPRSQQPRRLMHTLQPTQEHSRKARQHMGAA